MSLNDTLANALTKIYHYDKNGKNICEIKPSSKLIKNVLDLMKNEGFIGSYEEIDEGNGIKLIVNLLGKINKCGVIKPRFNVKSEDLEKFEKRYLLSKDFGMILVSTNQGLMNNIQAKEKGLGGSLIAYIY